MTVYLPTDFSECSLKACSFAVTNIPAAEYTLVHAIDPPQAGATLLINLDKELRSVAEEGIEEVMAVLKTQHPNAVFQKRIAFGSLNQVASRIGKPDDLFVVGTTGADGVEQIIGSNTSSLIRYAQCPVICVPSSYKDGTKISNVLFADDFKNDAFKEQLHKLARLLGSMNVHVDMLYVSPTNDLSKTSIESDLPELQIFNENGINYDMNYAVETDTESLEDIILKTAAKLNSDAVVTIPHHATFISGLFHRSISKRLTLHSNLPLIVVK